MATIETIIFLFVRYKFKYFILILLDKISAYFRHSPFVYFLNKTIIGKKLLSRHVAAGVAIDKDLIRLKESYSTAMSDWQLLKALDLRELYLDEIVRIYERHDRLSLVFLQALIEKGEFNLALKHMKHSDIALCDKINAYLSAYYCERLTQKSSDVKLFRKSTFLQSIIPKDKKVVIAGPGIKKEEDFACIKGSHCAIAMNYLPAKDMQYPDLLISYYNTNMVHGNCEETARLNLEEGFSSIDFAVFKSLRDLTHANKKYGVKLSKSRVGVSPETLFLDGFGSPQLVQYILMDLICVGAKNIEVFGVDLYTGEITYDDARYLQSGVGDSFVKRNLIEHDVLSNFRFISNLRNRKFCTFPEPIDDIFDRGSRYYAKILESRFPN